MEINCTNDLVPLTISKNGQNSAGRKPERNSVNETKHVSGMKHALRDSKLMVRQVESFERKVNRSLVGIYQNIRERDHDIVWAELDP